MKFRQQETELPGTVWYLTADESRLLCRLLGETCDADITKLGANRSLTQAEIEETLNLTNNAFDDLEESGYGS